MVNAEMSQEDLANAADIEISQVYRIENGLINPTITTLNALSQALEISLSELMDF
jgi:transcriptional regulator with XRE-family HTH domain